MKYITIILLGAGFGFLHSFLINTNFIDRVNKFSGKYFAFYRLFYNILSLILLAWLFSFTRNIDHVLVIKFVYPWNIIQYIMLAISALLVTLALFGYGALEFIGIRQLIELTEGKIAIRERRMNKTGILGIIRHPLYLATIILLWSMNATYAGILLNLVLTIYTLVGIQIEEKKLISFFGVEYVEYQRQVPALIPFIFKLKRRTTI